MSCVFRHLLRKWKRIANDSHELSLHSFDKEHQPNGVLYEHTCGNTTIREFCTRVLETTTIKYSWEDYMKDSSITEFSSQETEEAKSVLDNTNIYSILQSFEVDEPLSDCLPSKVFEL